MAEQKAILHAATRIVRRLTTDERPVLQADEVAVDLAKPIALDSGVVTLRTDGTLVVATQTEIDAAGMDPDRAAALERERIAKAAAALFEDKAVPQTVKDFLGLVFSRI